MLRAKLLVYLNSSGVSLRTVSSPLSQASPHFLRDIKESISRMAIPEGIVESA
jgi:hypothetical protein